MLPAAAMTRHRPPIITFATLFLRNQRDAGTLVWRRKSSKEVPVNQQNPNPSQKPGQQQQGDGHKPGQQQQDPGQKPGQQQPQR